MKVAEINDQLKIYMLMHFVFTEFINSQIKPLKNFTPLG